MMFVSLSRLRIVMNLTYLASLKKISDSLQIILILDVVIFLLKSDSIKCLIDSLFLLTYVTYHGSTSSSLVKLLSFFTS